MTPTMQRSMHPPSRGVHDIMEADILCKIQNLARDIGNSLYAKELELDDQSDAATIFRWALPWLQSCHAAIQKLDIQQIVSGHTHFQWCLFYSAWTWIEDATAQNSDRDLVKMEDDKLGKAIRELTLTEECAFTATQQN